MKCRIGDAVRVKTGTACPEFPELDMGGWQGRVTVVSDVGADLEPTVDIAWDSITLRHLPEWYVADSLRRGLSVGEYVLAMSDVEPASPRDEKTAARAVLDTIERRFGWSGIGPEGDHIQAVVNSAAGPDDWDVMKAWGEHLQKHLQFPFEAVFDEFGDRWQQGRGHRLTVLRIEDVDDLYGVIVACRRGRERCDAPLADLATVDERSPNAAEIQAYRVWFANR